MMYICAGLTETVFMYVNIGANFEVVSVDTINIVWFKSGSDLGLGGGIVTELPLYLVYNV